MSSSYQASKYCVGCWFPPKDYTKTIDKLVEKLRNDPNYKRQFLADFGLVEFSLQLYHDGDVCEELMVRIAALEKVYNEDQVETHCGTQRTELRFERGYARRWKKMNEPQLKQYLANLILRHFKRQDHLDKNKNCIARVYLHPEDPEKFVEMYITFYIDAHMAFLRRKEEVAYESKYPHRIKKSGAAGTSTLAKRYRCNTTYPQGIWDRNSLMCSNFIVVTAGVCGVIEGLPIGRWHAAEISSNIRPESISSTINANTSLNKGRVYYFMSAEERIGLDFQLLEKLSEGSSSTEESTDDDAFQTEESEESTDDDARLTEESRPHVNDNRAKRRRGDTPDWVRNGLRSNVCRNELMERTVLKELSPLEAIIDDRIVGNESEIERMFILGDDLEQVKVEFVLFLMEGNPSVIFSVEQFGQEGELKEFFEQLYIGVQQKYSTEEYADTFWRSMLDFSILKKSQDLSRTGGYVFVKTETQQGSECLRKKYLRVLLQRLVGISISTVCFGYLPTEGGMDHQFIRYFGICTDRVEFDRYDKIYRIDSYNKKAKESVAKVPSCKHLLNGL